MRTARWTGERATVETGPLEAQPGAQGDPGAAHDRMRRAGSPADPGVASASWQDLKSRFVDDPAGAIAAAEELVRQAVEQKMLALNAEAEAVCARDAGDDAGSTEALRTRLIKYQAYYERLARTRM